MRPIVRTNYLDTQGYDWTVSHLYEHCFLASFYNFLHDGGLYPQHIGWVNADNFKDVTFFESGFYDSKIQELFEKFIVNTPEFNDEIITNELKVMEAEELGRYKITDFAKLKKQLSELSARSFNQPYPKVKRQNMIEFVNRPRDFMRFSTKMTLKSNDEKLKKLFSRAFIFFLDEIDYKMRARYAIYNLSDSFVPRIRLRGDKNMFFISTSRIDKNSWNEQEINDFANNIVQQMDFVKLESAVQKHMFALANYPAWQSHMTERYRHTNMVIENQEIVDLCTVKNLKSIQQNLLVEAYKTKPSDENWVD